MGDLVSSDKKLAFTDKGKKCSEIKENNKKCILSLKAYTKEKKKRIKEKKKSYMRQDSGWSNKMPAVM